MYLEPKGIEADISETGWMFNHNNKYITLEEVIRTVYAGKLKSSKETSPPRRRRIERAMGGKHFGITDTTLVDDDELLKKLYGM